MSKISLYWRGINSFSVYDAPIEFHWIKKLVIML